MNRWLLGAPILLCSAGAMFFVTFASLFSDGGGPLLGPERMFTYALSLGVHGVLGFAGAKWGPGAWLGWAALACGPSVAFALLYASQEPSILSLALLYAGLALLGGVMGAKLGRSTARPEASSASKE